MSMVCHRFAEGKHPYTALEMSRIHNIPIRLTTDLLYDLVNVHLIIEVVGDEKGSSAVYLPYEDINNLNVGVMVDRLESYGKESLDLNYKIIYNEKWRQMLQNRVDFLNADREILLKDL
jgi:membrane protein